MTFNPKIQITDETAAKIKASIPLATRSRFDKAEIEKYLTIRSKEAWDLFRQVAPQEAAKAKSKAIWETITRQVA